MGWFGFRRELHFEVCKLCEPCAGPSMAREEECFLREEGEVGRAIENRVHVFLLVKFFLEKKKRFSSSTCERCPFWYLVCAYSVMSDSLRPYGLKPIKPLCPWDSPGKNTGLGCHFLLQRIFLTQGLNRCLLHWQADSLPLNHLGSPLVSQVYLIEASVFNWGLFLVCFLCLFCTKLTYPLR